MQNAKFKIKNSKSQSNFGFTLIEMIIYLAIVSIVLVSISYLILDVIGGQTKSYAGQEINQNIRYITNILIKDIKAAEDIGSLSSNTLVLTMSGEDITYNFDGVSSIITRQVGAGSVVTLNSSLVEVDGSFTDLSYQGRSKNISVYLDINFKNPENLTDYDVNSNANFSVELRGRR